MALALGMDDPQEIVSSSSGESVLGGDLCVETTVQEDSGEEQVLVPKSAATSLNVSKSICIATY